MDIPALLSELTGDPAGLGYAAHTAIRDDGGAAFLLNATDGPGAAAIQIQSLSRDLMLAGLRPSIVALASVDAAIQSKWDRILAVICAAESVAIDATTQALFAVAIADGIATQDQVTAMTIRSGSRAEVLWGAGFTVSASDVSTALNSGA